MGRGEAVRGRRDGGLLEEAGGGGWSRQLSHAPSPPPHLVEDLLAHDGLVAVQRIQLLEPLGLRAAKGTREGAALCECKREPSWHFLLAPGTCCSGIPAHSRANAVEVTGRGQLPTSATPWPARRRRWAPHLLRDDLCLRLLPPLHILLHLPQFLQLLALVGGLQGGHGDAGGDGCEGEARVRSGEQRRLCSQWPASTFCMLWHDTHAAQDSPPCRTVHRGRAPAGLRPKPGAQPMAPQPLRTAASCPCASDSSSSLLPSSSMSSLIFFSFCRIDSAASAAAAAPAATTVPCSTVGREASDPTCHGCLRTPSQRSLLPCRLSRQPCQPWHPAGIDACPPSRHRAALPPALPSLPARSPP